MPPEETKNILTAVCAEISPERAIEVTLEANPGTLDSRTLDAFLKAGVNRISLGVQALDDQRLGFLGRIHDRVQAMEAIKAVRGASGAILSVDLMAGTLFESVESWDRELDELIALEPDGISFYSLSIEEGTELARLADQGEPVFLPADATVDLLLHVAGRLKEAGYRHYEVSNWAKPGSESRHNLHYWQRGPYLGLGPSAHSYDGATRTWNLPNLNSYRKALNEGKLPPSESETLTEEEVRTEWVYLMVRQLPGLNLMEYADRFGDVPSYWNVMFERIAESGLGDFDGEHFKPNDRGLLLADEIAGRILG